MEFFLAALASFAYIGLKATQQRQVMAAQYTRMPLLSVGMACCEVFIMSNVVRTADSPTLLLLLALSIGLGGGAGSVVGTYLHVRRYG